MEEKMIGLLYGDYRDPVFIRIGGEIVLHCGDWLLTPLSDGNRSLWQALGLLACDGISRSAPPWLGGHGSAAQFPPPHG